MTRTGSCSLILVALLCRGTAGEAGEPAEEPRGFWVDIGLGRAWTHGNDVRVAQRSTAAERSGEFILLGIDADSRPLRTHYEPNTMLLARAGVGGEVWGVEGQLWQLGPGASTDAAFEIEREGQPLESLQLWGRSFNNTNSLGEHQFTAENQTSVYSGRLEVTRSVGKTASIAVGLHMARLKNERSESLAVISPNTGFQLISSERTQFGSEARGWMLGPSVRVRVATPLAAAIELSFSVSQSVLFTDTDHGGTVSIRTELLGGLAEQTLELVTRFHSRVAVPVSEVQGAVTFELTDHLSIGLEGLFSAWRDVPLALDFSVAEGDSLWIERQRSLVFAQVGSSLRLRF